jgi:hypothetical protein
MEQADQRRAATVATESRIDMEESVATGMNCFRRYQILEYSFRRYQILGNSNVWIIQKEESSMEQADPAAAIATARSESRDMEVEPSQPVRWFSPVRRKLEQQQRLDHPRKKQGMEQAGPAVERYDAKFCSATKIATEDLTERWFQRDTSTPGQRPDPSKEESTRSRSADEVASDSLRGIEVEDSSTTSTTALR